MTKRRVVVTGLGLVTPLGLDVSSTWQNIVAGKSGVEPITEFDVSEYSTRIWAAVKNFEYEPKKDIKRLDKFSQFGMVAADEALSDAGLEVTEKNAHRIGVAVGSGIGGLQTITDNHRTLLDAGPRRVSPFFIPAGIINMVAGNISIKHGLKGPNISIVTACTTGTHNIGTAARMIAYGDADVMVAGGSEYSTNPLCLAGFAAARALSKNNDDPKGASRPFDQDRDGFVLGEGAGVLILEEYEHAKARGAKIHAELGGFGWSADAFHMTSPDEDAYGASLSISGALNDAGVNANDVDYINAHGTSTKLNDQNESKAIKKVFQAHASDLAISSTKSMIGHLLGAAGAVEAVFSVLSIRDNVAPPTINLQNPDEICQGLNLVPGTAQERNIQVVLSNSFGFGGTNGSLLFKAI